MIIVAKITATVSVINIYTKMTICDLLISSGRVEAAKFEINY